jgi:hypothetical protein
MKLFRCVIVQRIVADDELQQRVIHTQPDRKFLGESVSVRISVSILIARDVELGESRVVL